MVVSFSLTKPTSLRSDKWIWMSLSIFAESEIRAEGASVSWFTIKMTAFILRLFCLNNKMHDENN